MEKWPYYTDNTLRRFLLQFMAIFAGMQVEIQKHKSQEKVLIPVPIVNGSKDRVAAAIIADNTQNKPIRLPTMSAYFSNVDLAPELKKGRGVERTTGFLPQGGIIPDDLRTVVQRVPTPYKVFAELSIYASNQHQMNQIIEQILNIFDPDVEIQTSDSYIDWTRLTMVELVGTRYEENYPSATDRRMLITTLDFQLPIWMSLPATIRNDVIKSIKARVGAIDFADSEADIIDQLNDQGDYVTIVDGSDITI